MIDAFKLRLADDALVLSQRLSEWAARAPTLEEDVALLNVALDQIGVARSLLGQVGDEDALAYLRAEEQFTNAQLMELENGDFGHTMARLLLVSAYQVPLWEALSQCADTGLAGVAGKAVKESAYHLDHATTWVIRLGDGTEESHARMQAGLNACWPYAWELFEADEVVESVVGQAMTHVQAVWERTTHRVLAEATLAVPETTWRPTGGRSGRHTEAFGYLLAELQHLHRAHPGATW